jgi:hypothetical protein
MCVHAGAPSATTCVLDLDCSSEQLCSSDTTVSVCICIGGLDGCDAFSTCQPKPAPPAPAPAPVVLSPCESCRQCVATMQSFVGPLRFSVDTATNAPSFVSKCVSTYIPGDVINCRAIGDAISYSLDGNLAKRAGALCARMGNCTALLQGSISSCSLDLPGLPLGLLDLCTVEGINTGSMITPAASGAASSYQIRQPSYACCNACRKSNQARAQHCNLQCGFTAVKVGCSPATTPTLCCTETVPRLPQKPSRVNTTCLCCAKLLTCIRLGSCHFVCL